MPLSELTLIDILFLSGEGLIIFLATVYFYNKGTSLAKCHGIEINEDNLILWRISLYTSVAVTWLVSFMIFVQPSILRYIFYPLFPLTVVYMLSVSLPAFVCKRKGYGGTCNCDFYAYNDFLPIVALGTIGAILFTFIDLDLISGLLLLMSLIGFAILVYFFYPEKTIEPLKYPPEILINNVDELQKFLMQNPEKRKLVTLLDATCDFCSIQIAEINNLPTNILTNRIRLFDLTFKENLDPMISITLNIPDKDKIPLPTSFIIDSGMLVEQKDGVLLSTEIRTILKNHF